MSNVPLPQSESTAVDDVRRVRDRLDRESGGDLRRHIKNTNDAFEALRAKLNVKLVPAPLSPSKSAG
jgi:hypothetical protein